MPTLPLLPNSTTRELTDNYNDIPSSVARSPHPYRRRKREYASGTDSPTLSYLPSPALTPSDSEAGFKAQGTGRESGLQSPGYSGTEVDDESLCITKALPAPPQKGRKDWHYDHDGSNLGGERVALNRGKTDGTGARHQFEEFQPHEIKAVPTQARYTGQHRRRELSRRQSEVLNLVIVCVIVLSGARHGSSKDARLKDLIWPVLIGCGIVFGGLCSLYPFRFWHQCQRRGPSKQRRTHLASYFDPAPLLYPFTIPVLVSISLHEALTATLYPSVVLALSATLGSLVPYPECFDGFNTLHWLLSMAPVFGTSTSRLDVLGPNFKARNLDAETLALIYPMHRALIPPLRYLTTSSLLESEIQLLTTSLLILMLLAESPQMLILKYALWVGGLGLLIGCSRVLKWNVALERVPNWRFRRYTNALVAGNDFLSRLAKALTFSHATVSETVSNDQGSSTTRAHRVRPQTHHQEFGCREHPSESIDGGNEATLSTRQRSTSTDNDSKRPRHRQRTMSAAMQSLLSMTPSQALRRKWFYACYVYMITFLLILGPIRLLIQHQALQGYEPFAWAFGYLLGDNYIVQGWASQIGLADYIPLDFASLPTSNGWVDDIRWNVLGSANTRLALFGYFAAVVALGIAIVLSLSHTVEVDTRRKVFHGTMVVLLMPTAFIDPAFLSLGLALVLVVFLLLEVFRAGQVRPLSKPLAVFLGPYVDGRDLRGPVVVSHIFLLIGCAIPFWLSLAGISPVVTARAALGWEMATRDISMLSGVICVGLGDAAASLVGRRFGRHKWPWAGGKSLEGSLAFALAVMAGLVTGKAWLLNGAWDQTYRVGEQWVTVIGKAGLAGIGASFTEAVLTGCNDNVVVPVVLWLLVRGIRL